MGEMPRVKRLILCVVGLSIFLCGSAQAQLESPGGVEKPNITYFEAAPIRRDDRRNVTELDKGIWNVTAALYQGLNKMEPGNFILSPLSLTTSMVMLNAGAGGETARQIRNLFKFGTDSKSTIQNHTSLLDSLKNQKGRKESGVELLTSSRIYANSKNSKLRSDYKTGVKPLGGIVNFEEPKKVVGRINEWIKTQTRGKISEIVEEKDMTEETAAVLLNALYFKAPWKHQFDASRTEKAEFGLSGDERVEVDMMYVSEQFQHAELPKSDASALFLPYKGDRFSMIIYLPWRGRNLSTLEANLENLVPTKIRNAATTSEYSVYLPKFNISSSLDLKGLLNSLGVEDMFIKRGADFSVMSYSDEFHVSKILHRTFIQVNEEGTEAAAATATHALAAVSASNVFRVDRPFIFQIFDHVTGAVLLNGRITNPNEMEPVATETESGEQRGSSSTAEAAQGNTPVGNRTTIQLEKDVLKIQEQLKRIEASIKRLDKKRSLPESIAAVLYPHEDLQTGEGFPLTFGRESPCMNLPPNWVKSVYVNEMVCVHLYKHHKCDGSFIKVQQSINDLSKEFTHGPKSIKNCRP